MDYRRHRPTKLNYLLIKLIKAHQSPPNPALLPLMHIALLPFEFKGQNDGRWIPTYYCSTVWNIPYCKITKVE